MATTDTVARSQARRRELADRLEVGYSSLLNSESYQQYLQTAARFHTYSAGNVLLIMMQRPDATRVAGFKAWQRLGRQVRRGERAIRIFAPMVYRARDEDGEDDEQARRVAGFRTVSVFDVSQTDGDELPEFTFAERLEGDDDGGLFVRLAALAERNGLQVSRRPELARGDTNGYYTGSMIWVRPDVSARMAAKTMAHELGHHFAGHALGSCREAREITAESVAFVTLGHYGIDTGAYSFGYLLSWADDAAQLRERLGRVLELANTIIDGVDGLAAEEQAA